MFGSINRFSAVVFLLSLPAVAGVKVPRRLRKVRQDNGLVVNVSEEDKRNLEVVDGLLETTDCVGLDYLLDYNILKNPVDGECDGLGGCSGGCCRLTGFSLQCDDTNSRRDLMCVCNDNTRVPGQFQGLTASNAEGTVRLEPTPAPVAPTSLVSSAFEAGISAVSNGKGGKGKGKGKGKDDDSSEDDKDGASLVSSTFEFEGPTIVPYVSPNGATITSIVVTPASPGLTAPAPAPAPPGPVDGTIISSAVETPGEPDNTPIGNNGATATIIAVQPAPGNVGVTTPAAGPAPGQVNVPAPAPQDGTIISSAVETPGEPDNTPIGNNGATATITGVRPGPGNVGVTTPAGPAPGQVNGPASGQTPPGPAVTVPAPVPVVNNNEPVLPVVSSALDADMSHTPSSNVPSDACADGGDWYPNIGAYQSAYQNCTTTANQCNQAAGECCLDVFCICGKPNGDILGKCVPDFDYDLLQATNP